MKLSPAVVRQLLRVALADSLHHIPRVSEMTTGHKKRLLNAGIDLVARDITNRFVQAGVEWSKNAYTAPDARPD